MNKNKIMINMTLPKDISQEDWAIKKLETLTYQELMDLFKSLSSVGYEEMDDEYDANF